MKEKYWLTQINKDELSKLKKGDELGLLSDTDEFLNPLRIRLYSLNGISVGVIPDKYFEHVNYHLNLSESKFINPDSKFDSKIDVIEIEPSQEGDEAKDFPMCRIIIDWHIKESDYIPFDNTTYIGAPKPNKYIQPHIQDVTTVQKKEPNNIALILFVIAIIILAIIIF